MGYASITHSPACVITYSSLPFRQIMGMSLKPHTSPQFEALKNYGAEAKLVASAWTSVSNVKPRF